MIFLSILLCPILTRLYLALSEHKRWQKKIPMSCHQQEKQSHAHVFFCFVISLGLLCTSFHTLLQHNLFSLRSATFSWEKLDYSIVHPRLQRQHGKFRSRSNIFFTLTLSEIKVIITRGSGNTSINSTLSTRLQFSQYCPHQAPFSRS